MTLIEKWLICECGTLKPQYFKLMKQGLSEVSYRETEHYNITGAFLENPDRMLSEIFSE